MILARGLEVEIARALAKRLGIPRVRFVYVRPASRLLAAKVRPVAPHDRVDPAGAGRRAAVADLSDPYLVTDQAVVLRRGLPRLTSLARPASADHLRTARKRRRAGDRGLRRTRTRAPLLVASDERLLELVRTGVCDAALVDATVVGRFVAGRGALLGPVPARVAFGAGYVVAVTRGGPIAVADVDRALARMRADGTLHRLARRLARDRPCPAAPAALTVRRYSGCRRRPADRRSTGT